MSVLKARVGGAWVAVPMAGGPDEVFVGPAAPTDSATELWYDTAAVPAVDPAKMPRGIVGQHVLTTAFSTTGTHTTLQDEGLTLAINEGTGRFYKITLALAPYTPGGPNTVTYMLLRNGVQIRGWDIAVEALSTSFTKATVLEHVVSGATATGVIYKLQMRAVNSNTSVTSYGAALIPRSMLIEDIGGV